jgi:hypothetical protein
MAWRADVDSLVFQPPDHAGHCFIHRRAFVTLCAAETIEDCQRYYVSHQAAIFQAAAAKLQQSNANRETNFHLNSRDIARAVRSLDSNAAEGAV